MSFPCAASNGTHTIDLSSFQDGTVTVAISATDTAGNHATGTGDSTTRSEERRVGKERRAWWDRNHETETGEVNAAHAEAASDTVVDVDAFATANVTYDVMV